MKQLEVAQKKLWAGSPEELIEAARAQRKQLISLNAECLVSNDEAFTTLINDNIGFADGIGAVYAAARKGFTVQKVAGCELWLESIKRFTGPRNIWLVGASEDVNRRVAEKLLRDYPDARIIGRHHGFFDEQKAQQLIGEIRDSNASHVFVALGQPRQELFLEQIRSGIDGICMGIGGAFDVYSGLKKRAPSIFIKTHTEWLYRFAKEPKRIGRSVAIPKLLWRILWKRI